MGAALMRTQTYLVILMVLLGSLWLLTAPSVLADDSPVCSADALFQGTCGDRVCDAYRGENATTCPVDCAPPTSVPFAASTATRTPTPRSSTSTLTLPPTSTQTGATTPTVTSSPTPTEVVGTLEGTTEAMIQPGFSLLESVPRGCRFVDYLSLTDQWQALLATGSEFPEGYIPNDPADQEVLICDEPISGEVCFPVFHDLASAAAGDDENIALVDCSSSGNCTILDKSGHNPSDEDDVLCFAIAQNTPISCGYGCVLTPLQMAQGGAPITGLRGNLLLLLIPLGLLILLILGGLLILFMLTRRRDEQDKKA